MLIFNFSHIVFNVNDLIAKGLPASGTRRAAGGGSTGCTGRGEQSHDAQWPRPAKSMARAKDLKTYILKDLIIIVIP